jgi:RNA polymerase sigma-70 factor, ECF subfamily
LLRDDAEGVILLLTIMLERAARDSWQVLGQRLGAYIGRRLPAQDVDDVLQEVLLRIHKNVRYLGDDSRFGPWVYSVARNAVIDRLRKKQPVSVDLDPDSLAAAAADEEEQALLGCVTPFVARLPEAYRHAITLVELQGLSQVDAAAIEGVSVSGMKSRVQRARRMLREMFEECCSLKVDARGHVIEAEPHAPSGCAAPGGTAACEEGTSVHAQDVTARPN